MKEIISNLQPEDSKEILELISYDTEEAGGLMSTDYFAVTPQYTIQETKDALRKHKKDIKTVSYVYIIDNEHHPIGVLSLRELTLANDEDLISKHMVTNVFSVTLDTPYKEIAIYLTKYNLFSITVVDQMGKLVGIVMIDDIMRKLFPDA